MSKSGTQRSNIVPGAVVSVVLKADQGSDFLTHGTVQALLTNSENHPRGIKVRLTSGQVGRVQKIHPEGSNIEALQIQTQHEVAIEDEPRAAPHARSLGDFLFPIETSSRTTTVPATTKSAVTPVLFPWSCTVCTFENTTYELECEMCNTLRQNYGLGDT